MPLWTHPWIYRYRRPQNRRLTPVSPLNHALLPLPNPNPNPNPSPSPLLSRLPHPDYAELITAAITALKEKEGSSRIAIAKYIDRVYSNLPPNHSALLTHHLKRLKNSGYLAMVKHSYMLAAPGSAPPPPDAAVDSNGTDVSSLSKRKPGRPPKLKAEAQPQAQFQDQLQAQIQAQLQAQQQQAQFQTQFQNQPQFIQQQPQYVPQPQFQPQMQFQADPLLQNQLQFQPQAYAAPEAQNYSTLGAESVFVSLGLADGPVGVQNPAASVTPAAPATALEESTTKRRPGRPRKDGSTVVKSVEPKLPNQSGTKKRPGRPPKTGTGDASPGSAVAVKPRGRPRKGSAPSRRGRPRKNVAVSANVGTNAANTPAGGDPSGATPTPKRRGRPPKSSNQGAAGVGVTDVPIAAAFDSEGFPDTVGGVTNGAMPLGKRRGRPPKQYSSAAVATTVKRPRKLSGRPLGRPKKNVTSPAVSDPKLVVAYEELKGKLEHMQSRIREAANALKPCLNAETPATALAAWQELEELAAPAGVDPMQQN
ncbi:hypothetical protein HAX54_010259 [Datura stramonium]|uniref:H15 domain-containing protein n=1 Tax=Datura stramonium TaxID=4076 RepID=A0ABS8WVS6_DATST|nr:hypothetical protein [Datura stramonium]